MTGQYDHRHHDELRRYRHAALNKVSAPFLLWASFSLSKGSIAALAR